jgi:hypothetical protein
MVNPEHANVLPHMLDNFSVSALISSDVNIINISAPVHHSLPPALEGLSP